MIHVQAGRILGGNTLVSLLGRGGMGDVWIAERRGPERFVKRLIVKVIHPNLVDNPEVSALFSREARIAALLHHPYLVQTYAFDRSDDGIPFLTMEYVPGRNLWQLLRAQRGSLDVVEVGLWCRLLSMAVDGIAYVHALRDDEGQELGLVHRDIKPANIMIAEDGRPRVLDFGVARLADENQETRPGMFRGTPQYASPEQCRGEAPTAACDVFAFGILIYQVLAGRHPFHCETPLGFMQGILATDQVPLSTVNPAVPAEISGVIDHALEKETRHRYANAGQLRDALTDALGASGLQVSTERAQGFGQKLVRMYNLDHPVPAKPKPGASPQDHTGSSTRNGQPTVAKPSSHVHARSEAEKPAFERGSSGESAPSTERSREGGAAAPPTVGFVTGPNARRQADVGSADGAPPSDSARQALLAATTGFADDSARLASLLPDRAATPATPEQDDTSSMAAPWRRSLWLVAVVVAGLLGGVWFGLGGTSTKPKAGGGRPMPGTVASSLPREDASRSVHESAGRAAVHAAARAARSSDVMADVAVGLADVAALGAAPRDGSLHRAADSAQPAANDTHIAAPRLALAAPTVVARAAPKRVAPKRAAPKRVAPKRAASQRASPTRPRRRKLEHRPMPSPPTTVVLGKAPAQKPTSASQVLSASSPTKQAEAAPAARPTKAPVVAPSAPQRLTSVPPGRLPTRVVAYSVREVRGVLLLIERRLSTNLHATSLRGVTRALAQALAGEFNPGTPFRLPAAAIYRVAGAAYVKGSSSRAISVLLLQRFSGGDL